MNDNENIDGVCCEYCIHFEKESCNVYSASPWSKWDFCSHFRSAKNNQTIKEIIIRNGGVE